MFAAVIDTDSRYAPSITRSVDICPSVAVFGICSHCSHTGVPARCVTWPGATFAHVPGYANVIPWPLYFAGAGACARAAPASSAAATSTERTTRPRPTLLRSPVDEVRKTLDRVVLHGGSVGPGADVAEADRLEDEDRDEDRERDRDERERRQLAAREADRHRERRADETLPRDAPDDAVPGEAEPDQEDRDPAAECDAVAELEGVARVLERVLAGDRDVDDSEHDRKVEQREDVACVRPPFLDRTPCERPLERGRGEIEVRPPERPDERDRQPDREQETRVAVRLAEADSGGDDGLAERDDHEERVALREVRGGDAKPGIPDG